MNADAEQVDRTQQTADKLAPLQNVISAAQQGDKDATANAWSALQRPSIMEGLAEAWRHDHERASGMVAVLESMQGQIMKARALRSAIKNLAEVRAGQETKKLVDDLEDQLDNLGTLASCFGNNPPPTRDDGAATYAPRLFDRPSRCVQSQRRSRRHA